MNSVYINNNPHPPPPPPTMMDREEVGRNLAYQCTRLQQLIFQWQAVLADLQRRKAEIDELHEHILTVTEIYRNMQFTNVYPDMPPPS